MGLDDLMSSESAFVAAATATVLSPRARETVRRGAVLGLAGVLKVGDVVAGAARGAVRGVRGSETFEPMGEDGSAQAPPPPPAATVRQATSPRARSSGSRAKPATPRSGS